ncbi:AraC family transcriptional regulator, partial [Glaciimonas sp. GG7]
YAEYPDKHESMTTIGGYALAIAKALEYTGIDSTRIFQAVGIPLSLKNDPMCRLSVVTLTKLYRTCVDVTHNPYFGLTVARFIHISNLHALGFALAASSNLMEFCQRIARFFRLASQTCDVTVVESEHEVALHIRLLVAVSAETEDALMGFLVLAMRQLYKPEFNPLRVALSHPMPHEGGGPYETLFRAPVSFNGAGPVMVFAKKDVQQPLAGGCAELAQLNDNLATKYMARLDKNDVVATVRQKIIEYLPNGDCTRDKVASVMCISPTTLQFKLSQRDTNFHELLDSIRKELAASYVQQSVLSITEITFLLGFNDTSNFTRAFKRWEGMSPTSYRNGAGKTDKD